MLVSVEYINFHSLIHFPTISSMNIVNNLHFFSSKTKFFKSFFFHFCEKKLHFVHKQGWMHGLPSHMWVGGSVTEAFGQEQ